MKTKSVKKTKPTPRLKDLAAKKNPKGGSRNRRERDKLATNHNETFVRDNPAERSAGDQGQPKAELKDMAAKADVTGGARGRSAGRGSKAVASVSSPTTEVGGSCPPFACGTDSNHNETLVRDPAPTIKVK